MRSAILTMLFFTPLLMGAEINVLENDRVRIEVSPQNGSIIHIVDKRTNTDYVTDPSKARLFRLLIPRADDLVRHANSCEQKLESLNNENGTLTIRYRNLQISRNTFLSGIRQMPETRSDIDVTVTMHLEGDHVRLGLELDNRSPDEITDVAFPWLSGLRESLEGQKARLVIPSLSQKALSRTGDIVVGERARNYPSLLATSWANYEFKEKGIGIEAQSPPETQDLLFALNQGTLLETSPHFWGRNDIPFIGWNFYPHVGGQSRWVAPPVVIHVHSSDWHTIAGEHRDWYRKQYEPQASSAFRQKIGFATYRLKKDDGTVNWVYAEIPRLAEEAKAAGMRDVIIDGWRQREGPANPGPFAETADPRIGGGAGLKSAIEALRKQGVELAFSFHPTLLNTASKEYAEYGYRWAIKTRIQGNQVSPSFTYMTFDYPYEDVSAHYWTQIDPSSPATDYLLGQAKRLREEYGFRNLFLRGVGLQSNLSYNRETTEAPQRVHVAGYARFLGGLKALLPQGNLFMEGFNDLVNPYSTAGYTWTQFENAEILAWSIPWVPFSNDVDALEYDQANSSFARKILINLIVDGGDGTVGRYQEFAKHLSTLQALKEATMPYYADAEFRDREGLVAVEGDSGVVLSVFNNARTGQLGIVLANRTDGKKNVSFNLAPPPQGGKARLYRSGGGRQDATVSRGVAAELAPYEVAILGIDPALAADARARIRN